MIGDRARQSYSLILSPIALQLCWSLVPQTCNPDSPEAESGELKVSLGYPTKHYLKGKEKHLQLCVFTSIYLGKPYFMTWGNLCALGLVWLSDTMALFLLRVKYSLF